MSFCSAAVSNARIESHIQERCPKNPNRRPKPAEVAEKRAKEAKKIARRVNAWAPSSEGSKVAPTGPQSFLGNLAEAPGPIRNKQGRLVAYCASDEGTHRGSGSRHRQVAGEHIKRRALKTHPFRKPQRVKRRKGSSGLISRIYSAHSEGKGKRRKAGADRFGFCREASLIHVNRPLACPIFVPGISYCCPCPGEAVAIWPANSERSLKKAHSARTNVERLIKKSISCRIEFAGML
jgi:hypothetical protein